MMEEASLGIAFNPIDHEVLRKAQIIVRKKNFRELLQYL